MSKLCENCELDTEIANMISVGSKQSSNDRLVQTRPGKRSLESRLRHPEGNYHSRYQIQRARRPYARARIQQNVVPQRQIGNITVIVIFIRAIFHASTRERAGPAAGHPIGYTQIVRLGPIWNQYLGFSWHRWRR